MCLVVLTRGSDAKDWHVAQFNPAVGRFFDEREKLSTIGALVKL